MTSLIEFESNVGSVTFRNNVFENNVITTSTEYIKLLSLYEFKMSNCTFKDMSTDLKDNALTELLTIDTINMDIEGDYIISSVKIQNVSFSFMSIGGFTGTPTGNQTVILEDLVITDTTFPTRNDFIKFGPFISSENIEIILRNLEITNLYFKKTAALINLNLQIPYPMRVESILVQNITAGYFHIHPVSVSDNTHPVTVDMYNVTVRENDFKFSTFMDIQDYSIVMVESCTFIKNSAKFKGTALSISGDDSSVFFTECNFNNNNGLTGGLFYVNGKSNVYV
jgi:hypothetical protein